MKWGKLLSIIFYGGFAAPLLANNISVSNVSLTGRNVSAGPNNAANYVYVTCDVRWENSWRTSTPPGNWDAAWVFIKYRVGSGAWKHATLHPSMHLPPSGATITPSSDGKGVFLYSSADNSGTVNYPGIKLRWDYGADGVLDNDRVTANVLAIEMVYVPQGTFSLGSGGFESGSFTDGSWTSGASIPFSVTSENALTINTGGGNLWGTSTSGLNTIGSAGTLPASFPKGYNAFYCMKYSIGQGQYVDFLNLLTFSQQATRTAVSPDSSAGSYAMFTTGQSQHRSGIKIRVPGIATSTPAVYACDLSGDGNYNQPDDGQDVACDYLSWADGVAYAAWAGLRPMTELEFEKACRGTAVPVPGELAWGTTNSTPATSVTNSGTGSETASPSNANSNFNNSLAVPGPLRVGIFAGVSTNREQSGATVYGIMDMSGDLWERTVTVGSLTGRAFAGSHGTGVLDASGNPSGVSDWPGTNADGSGFRGGVWDSPSFFMDVSDRSVAALTSDVRGGNSNSAGTRGFRAVRTAP